MGHKRKITSQHACSIQLAQKKKKSQSLLLAAQTTLCPDKTNDQTVCTKLHQKCCSEQRWDCRSDLGLNIMSHIINRLRTNAVQESTSDIMQLANQYPAFIIPTEMCVITKTSSLTPWIGFTKITCKSINHLLKAPISEVKYSPRRLLQAE